MPPIPSRELTHQFYLSSKVKRLHRQRRTFRVAAVGIISFALLVLALPLAIHLSLSWERVALYLIFFAAMLFVLAALRARSREINASIDDADFQRDLYSYPVADREARAEKILRLNDLQLRRYYDLNLSQNVWVFGLGVFCIALGILIIGLSLYLVVNMSGKPSEQIITAVLGGVGAILANFVAVIYLKMNASTTETLADFHSRLVETHQALFSNFLASRIDDDGKRWDTLSNLAVQVGEPKPKRGTGTDQKT